MENSALLTSSKFRFPAFSLVHPDWLVDFVTNVHPPPWREKSQYVSTMVPLTGSISNTPFEYLILSLKPRSLISRHDRGCLSFPSRIQYLKFLETFNSIKVTSLIPLINYSKIFRRFSADYCTTSEAYLQPYQISMMETFSKNA